MKVFISGAEGALGLEMQNILKREKVSFLATDIKTLDIADFKKTNETILSYRPDVLLHFAAVSDVDECERNRDLAYRVNALGTLGLATSAKKINAKILYTSTNFVFDGETEKPYLEYDKPNPINVYGKTKLLGEYYIKDLCARYYIIRTAWLFGKNSKTFISKFLRTKDKPKSIDVIYDQVGSFTYIPDLAEALFQLMKSENYGLFHIVNCGIGSWLDFTLKAKELIKFSTDIRPIKSEELKLPAARPRFAGLASRNYEFLFDTKMRSWEEALAAFVKCLQS